MPATAIEVPVLSLGSIEDSRVAIERLAAIGPVVFLRGLRSERYSATASGADTALAQLADLHRAGEIPEEVLPDAGHRADPRAIARLESVRAEHGADWLIATEGTVASARACPGLRIICVGPALDQLDPTRPDHRTHSLLDAARIIEAAAAFA